MSSKERIGIILDVDAEVSKAKGNISSLSKIFDGVGGSKGNQLRDLLSDISAEYEKLANESGKTMSKVGDFTKAEKSSERLSQLLRRLDKEVGNIGKSSKSDLSKFFPAEVADRVKKASDAVKTYNTILDNSSKKKGAIGAAADEYEKQERAARKAAEALKDLQDIQNGNSKKQAVTSDVKVKKQESLTAANADVKKYSAELEAAQKAMDEFKVRKADLFAKGTQNKSSEFRTLRDDLAAAENNFKTATDKAADLRRELKNMVVVGDLDAQIEDAENALKEAQDAAAKLKENLDKVTASEFSRAFDEAKKKLEGMSGIDLSEITNIDDLNNLLQRFTNEGIQGLEDGLRKAGVEIRDLGNANTEVEGKVRSNTAELERQNRALEDVNGIKNRILQFFSLTNAMQLGRQAIRETIETVKELDKSMTETAVVTDFSVGDMWDQLPEYTDMARQYGVAIKGVYDASTLYYQQGLNQQQTMQLTGETLKMARIAGLDYAEATDLMTAALRGFNMELNEANATRINDVYSELAAITAADTEEIATAMTKTASIASSANMEFETTAALLSQIIETTREPAETAGTAMKTIIARFTEMKKATSDLINIDGEEVSVNKVEDALRSAGVALRDANGEFRDLDDVFLELSSKWDGLDVMTQRYVATMAAGSRQQSRFIAMMQNYDRTMELVDAAYDSTGASASQFGKTQESLETKIANLEAAWQEFLMGISNSDAIKGIIDLLTGLVNALNEATTGVGGFSTFMLRMFSVAATFKIGKGIFNKIFASINTELFQGGTKGGSHLVKGISQGTHKNFGEFAKSLKKNIASKIESIFKTTKLVPKIPIKFDFGEKGSIGVKEFAKTLSSQLTPEQLGNDNTLKSIGATLEASVKSSLAAHGLQDEGAQWANGLGDGFEAAMKKEGADIQAVIAKIMAEVKAQVANSKVDIELDEDGNEKNPEDKGTNQQKDDFVKDIDNNDFQIDDDMLEKTEEVEANVMGIGAALTTASMAANLVTQALADSGAVSEDTAQTISNLSNGLSTAGTLMMALKAASDMFNISANMNPYIIAISAIIAGLTIVSGIFKKMKEDEKEANQERINTAKDSQEQANAAKQEIDAYNELLDAYNETGEGAEDLQKKKEELIETLELEKYGVNALTSSYEEVAEAAKNARAEMLATNLAKQQSGLQGATSQAVTEGSKPGWGGAGWINGGTGFEIDVGGSDSYNSLVNIFKEIASEKGINNLTYSKNGSGNLQIGGLDNSAEGRRLWMEAMSAVLNEYGTYLTSEGKDTGNAWAYTAMSEYWGKVSGYYDEANASQEGIESTEAEQAAVTAEETAKKEKNINSMQKFDAAVSRIIDSLSSYTSLSDEQKRGIAISALEVQDPNLERYGKAYTQILKMANNNTKDELTSFIQGLSDTDIRLIADLEVNIDEDSVTSEIIQDLDQANVADALFGSTKRMSNLSTFSDKLLAGEVEQKDIDDMTSYIADDFGPAEQREWELVQDEGISTQIDYLQELADKKKAEGDAARQTYLTAFDDGVLEDIKYYDGTGTKEGYTYQKDKAKVDDNTKVVNAIKTDTKDNGNISKATMDLLTAYTNTYNVKGKDYYGEWNALQHAKQYNDNNINRDNDYIVYDQETVSDSQEKANRNASWEEVSLFLTDASITGLPGLASELARGVYNTGKNVFTDAQWGLTYDEAIDANSTAKTTAIETADTAIAETLKDLALSASVTQNRIDTKDQTAGRVFYDAGLTSQNFVQDRTGDKKADYYDVKDLVGELHSAFDVLTNTDDVNLTEAFDSEGKIKTDLTDVTDQSTKDWITKVQELEKQGIKINTELNDDGTIKKATVQLERFDEEGNKIEDNPITVEVDGSELDDLADQIEELDGSLITIETEIKQADAEAAKSSFQVAEAQAQNLVNALKLVNSNLTVSPEAARQLQSIFPELLEGATAVGDKVKLNETTYNEVTGRVKKKLEDTNKEYQETADTLVQTTQQQATAFTNVYNAAISGSEQAKTQVTEDTKEMAKEYVKAAMEKERQAQAEAQTTTKLANLGIDSAEATTVATISGLSQVNDAIIAVTQNYVNMWKAGRGEEITPEMMASVASEVNKQHFKDFVDTTDWVTEDDVMGYLDNYDSETGTVDEEWAKKNLKDEDGDGNLENEIANVREWADVVLANANEDKTGINETVDAVIADAQTAALIKDILAGGQADANSKGNSKDKKSKAEQLAEKTNTSVENIDQHLKELDRQLERGEITEVEHKQQRDVLLGEKGSLLSDQMKDIEKASKYYNKAYYFDETAQAYLYNTAEFDKLSDEEQDNVEKELRSLNELNDQVKEIKDEVEDFEFKHGGEAQYYQGHYGSLNADKDLASIDRKRQYRDRYGNLVSKLPEEVQGPLNMGLLGMDMVYEAQEIQVNQGKLQNLQAKRAIQEQEAKYLNDYYYYDPETDSYKYYEDKMAEIFLNKELREAIEEDYDKLATILEEENAVEDELYGGVIQDGAKKVGKALTNFSKEISDSDFDDGLLKVETGFDKLDDALNSFIDGLEDNEALQGILETKVLPSLNLNEEQATKLVSNEHVQNWLKDNPERQRLALAAIGSEGISLGNLVGGLTSGMGEAITGAAGFLNFDMMEIGLDMFNGAKGMVEQGMQMVEKIIGYITQATQVIVDAWTNREDYLYNFLKVIEKHLQEYEKLQRYSTQLEKGRLSSSQDILNNWNNQWKSLQLQLEEQQERLETRQQELDRSRWNPFSLISGWDPTSDTLYENREVKFMWDLFIGFGQMAPMGLGSFFSQLNQLYEDYDERVQNSYEDRLAAEQALLDIEDERLELVKVGSEEATEFEQKLLDSMIQKEQEQIDELSRLNDAITDANSKLISTLQDNLDKMRQDRENEKKEEELGEKERRLAYLRQDTSGANMMEIKDLEKELEEDHEDYTDTLIDQKISELEKQNELAAEQRQQQIDLLQGQLDYAEKYGLYWDAIYGMLYTIDENGNAILNPENFDLDGNIRENSQLAQMLGTFSDRLGMSVWSSVLDNEETKRLGRYYGAFIGMNGVDGNWANYWALKDPGANDPNYAYPEQEIPDGLLGVLYKLEIGMAKYFGNSNLGLVNGAGRMEQYFKNFFGKLFGNDEWANYVFPGFNPAHQQAETMGAIHEWELGFAERSKQRWDKFVDLFDGNQNNEKASRMGQQTTEKAKSNMNNYGTQNYGAVTENYNFNIGTVGENISLDDMVDRVSSAIRGLFTSDGVGGLQKKR